MPRQHNGHPLVNIEGGRQRHPLDAQLKQGEQPADVRERGNFPVGLVHPLPQPLEGSQTE